MLRRGAFLVAYEEAVGPSDLYSGLPDTTI